MPATLTFSLKAIGLGLGFMGLAYGFAVIPLDISSTKAWVFSVVGLGPLPFLGSEDRRKYLCAVIIMAGASGLLFIVGNFVDCRIGAKSCRSVDLPQLLISGSIYVALLGFGWRWMNKISRRAKPQADE